MDAPGAYSSAFKQHAKPTITPGNTNNRSSLSDTTQSSTKSLKTKPSLFTLCEPPTVHDLTGANIKLEVNSVVIKTHEYLISKFVKLNKLVEKARLVNPQSDAFPVVIRGDSELGSDFLQAFKILGASSIEAPANFDLATLVSAARVASMYEHPALRTFCIRRLEGLSFNPMERLRVARILDLRSWEERVYQELSEREEMITKEEALSLGIDAYWKVASMRERQQNQKPRDYTCEILFFCIFVAYALAMNALSIMYVVQKAINSVGLARQAIDFMDRIWLATTALITTCTDHELPLILELAVYKHLPSVTHKPTTKFMDTWNQISDEAKPETPTTVASDTMNNQSSLNATAQPRAKTLKTKPSLLTVYENANVHDLTGANIRLQINNEVIKTHESRINKFARLKQLIKEARQGGSQEDTLTITIDGGRELVQDFLNMFKLLSASSIEKPQYDSSILVSAACVAATNAYDYQALYDYCIEKLEELPLSSMERVHVARALGLKSWEEDAYKRLSQRKEAITQEEASTLGMNAYWRVATAREQQKGAIVERILQRIERLSGAFLAARQGYMTVLKNVFLFCSLCLWLSFLLWLKWGNNPIQIRVNFKHPVYTV
ncbi:hypothetical protein B0J17DRAFT_763287 [Rhizoctonia solani]|nr:hypothetical protein B0J17DRAFT_763287 [Rhizoctonia solani]